MVKMIRKILNKIENKRDSENYFLNILVECKDFLWKLLDKKKKKIKEIGDKKIIEQYAN